MSDAAERAAKAIVCTYKVEMERIGLHINENKTGLVEQAVADVIREELARDAPKWTSERPTEPGWYWCRPGGDSPIGKYTQVLWVTPSPDIEETGPDTLVQWGAGCAGCSYLGSGEWCGPLKPPE